MGTLEPLLLERAVGQPATWEHVQLLQIAAHKTDAERLPAIPPELADLLSTIIVTLIWGMRQTWPVR